VNFVYDINPVPGDGRGEVDFFPQIPDIVHTVVGSGVNLYDIENGAVVDSSAVFTFVAGVAVLEVQAVYRLGEYLGAGGFSCPPGTSEQIGMGNTPGSKLIFQRSGNHGLAVYV